MESDAINVIQAAQFDDGGLAPIHIIFDDIIRNDSLPFDVCTFSYVKRNFNTIAHFVARWDIGNNVEYGRSGSFPQSIITFAEMDLL